VQGLFCVCAIGVQLVEQGLALVVVAAVGVVGFLVGAAAAVGADDGGEGAGGDGEEDFELQRQVADELVAFVGAVDAD
jgi:hypothetical protein